ncbi:ATP-dependent DNA helicase [Trichonephila clavata]|uniref:ATP-dependent DNA helicase n=1 Tax=Trichonephila clavata TaxID=2740835 RepID=A0A8X6F8R6_TRICU|nr:ATP-dependent DNA helicase [Trichonephila clavata]
MAVIGIGAENSNDEVTQYQMGRYVSSNEAVWRIFSFPIHERHPSVVHLAVHLENGQRVYFTAQNAVQRAAQPPSTTLTSFFETCQNDDFAQTLLYSEMPKYYTWNQSSRRFIRRKQGKPVPGYTDVYSTDAIGRIYSVHPSNDECFYLRLLLRGPTSFRQLLTVDGELCGSYREACQRLQLLENDAHWDQTLNDAVISSHAHQIRTLFSIIISTCFPSNPIDLWIKYKDYMCDDILYQIRNRMGNPNIQISEEIYNEALISIEDMCLIMSNKLLIQLGLTAPNRPMHDAFNQEWHRERLYDLNTLKELIQTNLPLLNEQQKYVFETLMKVTNDETGGIYFLDAPGDRTLKDLRSNNNRFGGAMILLAGDFRQTLPVIPRSTPADELNACLKSSNLWKHVKVLHLSKNMRVDLQNDQSGNIFSKQPIDIGNGKFPIDMLTGCINFPQSFSQLTRSKDELIQKMFPDVSQNYRNHDWLSERAILAAKNIDEVHNKAFWATLEPNVLTLASSIKGSLILQSLFHKNITYVSPYTINLNVHFSLSLSVMLTKE